MSQENVETVRRAYERVNATLELSRELYDPGFGLPGAAAVASRIEHSFHRQVQALPDDTRQLLLTDTIRACPFGCGHLVAALSSVPCMATLSRRALHDSPYVPGPADPWERPVTDPGATQPLPTRP
jgi:hypothetical protein